MTTNQDPWLSPTNHVENKNNIFDDNFVSTPPTATNNGNSDVQTKVIIPSTEKGSTPASQTTYATNDEVSKGVKKIANRVDAMFATNYMSNEDYAKKLESKLKVLQKQKQPNGKDMLENLKERKDFYLSELLSGLDMHNDHMTTMSAPSFLDRLYSTNELYRHLNPQQALDSSEKEPFAKHDYLAKSVENADDGTNTNDDSTIEGRSDVESTETSGK